MSAIFAWPAELRWKEPGVALTFVVPAHSCNLSCSFCAIRQRREAAPSPLLPADYARFISEVARSEPTAMVSIQGYEPLLPESWPYTRAILETAKALGLPRSLVTNGVLLKDRAAELAELDPTGLTVSIDSYLGAEHDRLRGRVGAFQDTVDGIVEITRRPGFAARMTVSSVLLPRRRHLLDGMPALLADLGIAHWAVSPLLRIRKDGAGGAVAPSQRIIDDVLNLHEHAKAAGVTLVLDDELQCLQEGREDYRDFLVRRFDRPDGLVRVTPTGAVSIGRQILREVDARTPVWTPDLDPVAFLGSARQAALLEAA